MATIACNFEFYLWCFDKSNIFIMRALKVNELYKVQLPKEKLLVVALPYTPAFIIYILLYLPKTKKFGCVGRGDLTSLFFSKVVKY